MIKKRIYIVEDDPIISSDLEITLQDLDYDVCGNTHDPFEAKKQIEQILPDLILLDINLNNLIDGIELATLIQNLNIGVVFISAFTDKKTIDRVKMLNPLGYIIKPFNEKDIEITLELAFQVRSAPSIKSNEPTTNFLFVKGKNGMNVKVQLATILYIEACDNYSFIHLPNEKFMVNYTLKELEQRLNLPCFHRIHRSYIVNIDQVSAFQYNYLLVNSTEIPIGKSYKETVSKLFPQL